MASIISLVVAAFCLVSLGHVSGHHRLDDNSRLNYFDIDLLRHTAEERRGNVMVSPANIKSTLAMILEAAGGDTASEIRSALRLSPNKAEFREQLNMYLHMLQNNAPGSLLQNANSVFVTKNLPLKREYDMILKSVYMTQVCPVNFMNSVQAAKEVNTWVSNMTKGLIPAIVEPGNIELSTQLLFTNALYFKGGWKHAFDPKQTRAGCFHVHGACRQVAMMELHAELNYAYVKNLRSHAVELPYEGGRYSMIILMPQDKEGAVALVRDLPFMSLPQISKLMEPNDVTLALPKFTVDYSNDMVEPLKSMRITSLFSTKSNLSGIFEGQSPQVNHIFHKVYMSVDEKGTIAAAATAAIVIPLIENGVQIRVDRPFVFFIRDNSVGLVLFEGKIEEPTAYVDKVPDVPVHPANKPVQNVLNHRFHV